MECGIECLDHYLHFFFQSVRIYKMSSSLERRNIFDQIALGCISHLEQCEECRTVTFQGHDPVAPHEIVLWERKNSPLKVPEDLKRFMTIMNGFTLNWAVDIDERLVPIGDIRILKLDQIIRHPCVEATIAPSSIPFMENRSIPDPLRCSMFILDSSCELGDIVLLYRVPFHGDSPSLKIDIDTANSSLCSQPEIWLLDTNGQLHYICSSFTQYLRLAVVHLGVIGWQSTFTIDGLSETTQHWMNVICKERLICDRFIRSEILKSRFI